MTNISGNRWNQMLSEVIDHIGTASFSSSSARRLHHECKKDTGIREDTASHSHLEAAELGAELRSRAETLQRFQPVCRWQGGFPATASVTNHPSSGSVVGRLNDSENAPPSPVVEDVSPLYSSSSSPSFSSSVPPPPPDPVYLHL